MASVKVFKGKKQVKQFTLESDKSYLVGRSEICDIQLDAEPGISRQHFRIFLERENWKIEVLSKFGNLFVGGEKQGTVLLDVSKDVEVPPYRFVFEIGEVVPKELSRVNDEKTSIGAIKAAAFLKVFDPKGAPLYSYRLEGDSWVAGRDTAVALFLDHPKFSRRHFEIMRQDANYFIRDLGSSNGTLLNGIPLSTDSWSPLNSSDILGVVDFVLSFEIRDMQFEQKIGEISPSMHSPLAVDLGIEVESPVFAPPPQPFLVPTPMPEPERGLLAKFKSFFFPQGKFNIVRAAIVGIAFAGLAMAILSEAPKPSPKPQGQQASPSFERLPKEQQEFVRQSFLQAKQLYYQGNYELAKQEIVKIHRLIPKYEDSDELLRNAEEAIRLMAMQARVNAEEEERRKANEKLLAQVESCKKTINSASSMSALEECLAPVLSINPDHPRIQELRLEIERINSERLAKEARAQEIADNRRELRSMFDRAEGLRRSSKYLEAISAYNAVIGSELTDADGLKGQSRQQISALKKTMDEKQAEFTSKAEQAAKTNDLKEAIALSKKALAIDPNNESIQERLDVYNRDLRKQLQNLYQEAILEESIGEVEVAKAKWKKIMGLSFSGEGYYEKSKIKLRKYGIE